MKMVWIIGNGVAVVSSLVCMATLYRHRWSEAGSRWPLFSASLIGSTVIVTALQFPYPELLALLRRNWESLNAGEWWRLITPLFVQPHGWIQCVLNGFFLFAFLPLAERLYGPRLLLLYFVPGIVGQVVNYSWDPYGGGASTGAFGIMGALLVYVIRNRVAMPPPIVAIPIAGLCAALVLSLAMDGHGPSMLAGALLAAFLRCKPLPALATDRLTQPLARL